MTQAILSLIVVALYSGTVTAVLLLGLKYTIGLRVDPRVEYHGLDLALHGETINEFNANLHKRVQNPVSAKQRIEKMIKTRSKNVARTG